MTRTTTKPKASKFDNEVRFNWGYHDAALAVRMAWDNAENNFGFCHHGPLAGLQTPEEVPQKHFDRAYARGWFVGYCTAKQGNNTESSAAAWESVKDAYGL